jgi:multiple sugar transport system ATP-binding protein
MTMSDFVAVMHQGVVQQFGTPADVYRSPANLFVAGFIGSPPMNFLSGVIQGGRFVVSDAKLPLPPLPGVVKTDHSAVLGVRPQDLTLVEASGADTLSGTVSLVELLGSEKLVEMQILGQKRISIQVRADTVVKMGDAVNTQFNSQRVHVFDAKTGQSMLEN